MAAFSTTDANIITHEVELDAAAQSATAASSGRSIHDLYDIHQTAHKVVEGRFRRVALQFPDEALIDSVPIYWALKSATRSLCNDKYSQDQVEDRLPVFYVLADTSYGSCCVDEVAAQHVSADLVVHYGHACLSPTARLPVIYVFTKQPIDVQEAASQLFHSAHETLFGQGSGSSSSPSSLKPPSALVLTYDVAWAHAAPAVYEGIRAQLVDRRIDTPFLVTQIDTRRNYEDKLTDLSQSLDGLSIKGGSFSCQPSDREPGSACCGGQPSGDAASCSSQSPRTASNGVCPSHSACSSGSATSRAPSSSATRPAAQISVEQERRRSPLGPAKALDLPESIGLSECTFLYLGPESLSLTNLLLLLGPSTRVISYDPLAGRTRTETGRTNRLLMKRYTHVLKARDASVVGLLVGTLGVHSYLPLLSHLRSLLTSKKSGRKVYTISVGKLNPAKLANFQEIDLFVLIACPENSLVDSKDFYRPIVTPFEMELALKASGDEVDWTGKYVLDLERLVPDEVKRKVTTEAQDRVDATQPVAQNLHGDAVAEEAAGATLTISTEGEVDAADEGDVNDDDDDQPHFSLITGQYVHRRKYGAHLATASPPSIEDLGDGASERGLTSTTVLGPGDSHTVALRNADGTLTTVLQSASTAHLENRGWKGLEQRLGLDEPSVLEEGREGIARGYKSAEGVREGTAS